MGITFVKSGPAPELPRKKINGHTKPAVPTISLDQPGRLRVANLLSLLGVSHSTFYAGLTTGRYPPEDGRDGRMPYWRTETIRNFLQGQPAS